MKVNEKQLVALENAVDEAERFIEKAKAALKRINDEDDRGYWCYSSKENAAAKRASMDLSRALTEVRRSKC